LRERKPEIRKRILKLREIGLRAKNISQILGIPPRTVRYYLQNAHPRKLSLRQRANLQDLIWIGRLSQAGASIEEISDILRLSGKVIFKVLMDQKPQGSTSDQPELQVSLDQAPQSNCQGDVDRVLENM
jgi:DNA-binding transcriptional MerR regulator